MSLRAFALREGFNAHSLWRWRKRLRGLPPAVMSFARVVAADAPHDAPFELVVGGGMSLRIPANFDEAALARLVAVLGRA